MNDVVLLSELKELLGDWSDTDDQLLQQLLDDTVALFEAATLRLPGYYAAEALAYTEVLDGTGSSYLYLAYPIAAVTTIKLGYDSATPDETLDGTNKAVVVFGVGSNVLTRTDGGKFGTARQPRYVEVVYDHQGNLPANAQLAIKSVCALAYRRRGSEEAQSESVGGYSHSMLTDIATSDPFWSTAVYANAAVVLA